VDPHRGSMNWTLAVTCLHEQAGSRISREVFLKTIRICGCALAGILSLGAPLGAQVAITPAFSQAATTGIVSFSLNESAQLNVLNLNPLPIAANAVVPACTVELEFRDAQNKLLKQVEVANVPPGNAASLTIHRLEASTSTAVLRLGIRGIVRTGLLTPATNAIAPPIVANSCTTMTTLEIFNDSTGETEVVTSDTRPITVPLAVPLAK